MNKKAKNKNTLFLFTDNRHEQHSGTARVLSIDHCHHKFRQPVIPAENTYWKEYNSA